LQTILRASPWFQHPSDRANSNDFSNLIRGLEDSHYSPSELQEHIYNARTHHLSHEGNLLECQTARPDVVRILHDTNDPEARQITEHFASILRSGKAYDPNELLKLPFSYELGGELVRANGVEIVHKVAELMRDRRVTLEVIDVKFKSRIGRRYKNLAWLWEECEGDVERIFSDQHLSDPRPEFNGLRGMWSDDAYDVAKTSIVLFDNAFRMAEAEYQLLHPDEPLVSLDDIMSSVRAGVMFVGFDISQGLSFAKLEDSSQPSKYTIEPSLDELHYPDKVTAALRYVDTKDLKDYWKLWEDELFAEVDALVAQKAEGKTLNGDVGA
jgi:hypothetical protein